MPGTSDELNTEISPFEGHMDWILDRENTKFSGRNALLERESRGKRYDMVTLRLSAHDVEPTGSGPVYNDDRLVGYISSAGFGHRVGAALAIAFIKPDFARSGLELSALILGTAIKAEILGEAAYDAGGTLARS